MSFSSSDFFRLFFKELERLDIPYVVLHSYDRFPEAISSDVDYSVLTDDLPKLAGIQCTLAESHGWRLAHGIESHIYAYYSVVIDAKDPRSFLQLDACSHYVEGSSFFLKDAALLNDRRRYRDFYVPAPAVEFAYLLAKTFGKDQPLAPRLAHLRNLWERDPAKTEEQFCNLCGTAQGTLAEWFARPDFEGCVFLTTMMEINNREHPVFLATVRHLANIRGYLRELADAAGVADAERFARQWHILMKGSIMAAAEGDASAAGAARELGVLLLR